MRLKTLGVFITLMLAAFTIVFWVTDGIRREAFAHEQEEELLEFGELVFSQNASEPAAAGCAQCHGPEGRGGEAGAAVVGPNLHSARVAERLRLNEDYVELVVRHGGIVVSGNPESAMPAWEDTLNDQQIEAVAALVTSWAEEAEAQPVPSDVPDTVEAGAEVYLAPGSGTPCASCHGPDLAGIEGQFPNIQGIGTELVTDLPLPVSGLDQMQADYETDPRLFLEKWIRDSAGNYNGGQDTGMPRYPEEDLPDSLLQALITFLLEGEHGG